MELATLMGLVETFGEIGSKLGILEAVKKRLASQPDVAATKLASALEELQKTILALENEIVHYLAINLERGGQEYRRDLEHLYSLEGGTAEARSSAARGHCGKIGNIYDVYLNPWFQKVTDLKQTEREALKQLFDELRSNDTALAYLIEGASSWLSDSAQEVLNHVENGDLDRANNTIARARKEILPVRKSFSQTLKSIRHIEADFIEISAIV